MSEKEEKKIQINFLSGLTGDTRDLRVLKISAVTRVDVGGAHEWEQRGKKSKKKMKMKADLRETPGL